MATVSRVLNHPDSVAEKTRNKIQKIMDEQGYTPNWFARGLNYANTNTIGLVVPQLVDPVYSEIVKGVEDVTWFRKSLALKPLLCAISEKPCC